MEAIISYVSEYWVQWLFTAALGGIAWAQKTTLKKFKEQRKEDEAVKLGMQAMLRDTIVSNYNKYHDKGYMPIYARESMKKIYQAYEGLGGNDVAHDLYNKMLSWDTDPDEEEEKNEIK